MQEKTFSKKIVLKLAQNKLNYENLSNEEWADLYDLLDFIHGGIFEEDKFDECVTMARNYIKKCYNNELNPDCIFNLLNLKINNNDSLEKVKGNVVLIKPEKKLVMKKQKMN
jgi:hypothetical protein